MGELVGLYASPEYLAEPGEIAPPPRLAPAAGRAARRDRGQPALPGRAREQGGRAAAGLLRAGGRLAAARPRARSRGSAAALLRARARRARRRRVRGGGVPAGARSLSRRSARASGRPAAGRRLPAGYALLCHAGRALAAARRPLPSRSRCGWRGDPRAARPCTPRRASCSPPRCSRSGRTRRCSSWPSAASLHALAHAPRERRGGAGFAARLAWQWGLALGAGRALVRAESAALRRSDRLGAQGGAARLGSEADRRVARASDLHARRGCSSSRPA